jgi:hypothetical protein
VSGVGGVIYAPYDMVFNMGCVHIFYYFFIILFIFDCVVIVVGRVDIYGLGIGLVRLGIGLVGLGVGIYVVGVGGVIYAPNKIIFNSKYAPFCVYFIIFNYSYYVDITRFGRVDICGYGVGLVGFSVGYVGIGDD